MEKRKLWGNVIPGNSSKRKAEVMELGSPTFRNMTLDTVRWILTVRGGKFHKNGKKVIDTYTHIWVKSGDPDYRDSFEDEPYLIPFIAEGSRQAVVLVPGGGYCMKSMENEGTQIAQRLQQAGITAFVLWYRTNPYYQPYPLMDMQRAVRYVRFHAKDYGYDPDKIGAIGFSAGGAQVSLFSNVLRRGLLDIPKYQWDEIDKVSDELNHIGLVYPALSYHFNSTMLYASFPAEKVRREAERKQLCKVYDAVANMNTSGIPHFICYGTKDDMVSLPRIQEYIEILKNTNTPYTEIPIEGAGHGYGASLDNAQYAFWVDEYIRWVKQQK